VIVGSCGRKKKKPVPAVTKNTVAGEWRGGPNTYRRKTKLLVERPLPLIVLFHLDESPPVSFFSSPHLMRRAHQLTHTYCVGVFSPCFHAPRPVPVLFDFAWAACFAILNGRCFTDVSLSAWCAFSGSAFDCRTSSSSLNLKYSNPPTIR